MIRLLSVDPGVECGWAVWNAYSEKVFRACRPPSETGLIIPPKGEWIERLSRMSFELSEVIFSKLVTHVVCEYPSLMHGIKGSVSARSGDLVKLSVAVGAVFEVGRARGCKVEFISVTDWKGQLPKEAVNKRIRRILGVSSCSSFKDHIWDAVGLGLFAKGCFN